MTEKQKQRVNIEIEKLSSQGLSLLNSFRKNLDNHSSILHDLVATNTCLAIVYICRGWMLAHDASESDIHHAGNVVNFTGVWGRWATLD